MNNEPNQKPANELTDKELEGVVGGCGDVSLKFDVSYKLDASYKVDAIAKVEAAMIDDGKVTACYD